MKRCVSTYVVMDELINSWARSGL